MMKKIAESQKYKVMGLQRVRDEFSQKHSELLTEWFNPDGNFVHYEKMRDVVITRERLWHCFSLLEQDDEKFHRLADNIIVNTHIDGNRFEPFAAVELLFKFKEKLNTDASKHLELIVREHISNVLDVRFSGPGLNNFTAMPTMFIVLASELLDSYEWIHPYRGMVDEGYTGGRLKQIAKNALYALAYCSEHEDVMREWNSSTYSTFTLQSLAKIVELSNDDEIRKIALEIEFKVWQEIFLRHHPNLDVHCGPYARAYRSDILQQNTELDFLFTYLGLSKCDSILKRMSFRTIHNIPPARPLRYGDNPSLWSNIAWYIATKFHIPEMLLDEYKNRQYPLTKKASIRWEAFGKCSKDVKGKTGAVISNTPNYLPVQGDLYPEGKGEIFHEQHENWALGFRTANTMAYHSFPIHFHYAVSSQVNNMADVRNVTVGVMFRKTPEEWEIDSKGERNESQFNHEGHVDVSKKDKTINFSGHYFPQDSIFPVNELSVNTFYPIHFGKPDQVSLNGIIYKDKDIQLEANETVCRIEDNGFIYEISYKLPEQAEILLYRWCNFLRFSVFFYRGKEKLFSSTELTQTSFKGCFKILKTN